MTEPWIVDTPARELYPTYSRANAGEGCPGVARGCARVVTDPGDPRGLEPGDILIAPLTDPAWTPLFVPATGVVVDVGALVEVDGADGTVTIVSLVGEPVDA